MDTTALALPSTDEIVRQLLGFLPALVVGMLLLIGVVLLRRLAASTIEDTARRYRIRKAITYGGVILVLILLLLSASS